MAQNNLETVSKSIEQSLLGSQWKKFGETLAPNQIVVQIGHINPELKMDKTLVGGGLISGGPAPVAATGVRYTPEMTRGNLKDFYTTMEANIKAGYMPGYTVEMIEDLRKKMNKTHPEEFDMVADVVVIRCADEKTAEQALNGRGEVSEGNIFHSQIPGAPEGMDMSAVLKNKVVQAQMTKEQKAQWKKMEPMMKDVGQQMKTELDKAGMKNFKGEIFGHPAIFFKQENHKICIGSIVKNFMITGSLLYSFQSLPDGDAPCESVSQFDSKKISERVEGATYHRTEVSPKESTIRSEGFLNRDEAEEILNKIFKQLG